MDRGKFSRNIRIVLIGLWLVAWGSAALAAEKKSSSKDAQTVMTQAELQVEVMAYADRHFSIVTSAYTAFENQVPVKEDHKRILGVCTYSISSAFTIAAQANPAGALMDMLVMVTLGRIIVEENMLPKYGPAFQPLVDGFRKAEKDIWQVAAKIGTPEQLQTLRSLILEWREKNPNILFFPAIRFSDFSSFRARVDHKKASGLFKSVANATQQVEEARLLAECGMFLATRMPLLAGLFGGVWFSQLANHPDVDKILNNINKLTEVSERLTVVAEQMPDKISTERDATIKQAMGGLNDLTIQSLNETAKIVTQERKASIDQLMQGLSNERKAIIEDFTSEEAKVRGLLAELRLTLEASNAVIVSADSLVKALPLEPSKAQEAAPPGKPFDVLEYQAVLREASHTILQVHEVLKTLDKMGLKSMLPQIIVALENLEKKGQAWVYFGFFLGVALILVFLVGSVIAALTYRHFALRIFGSGTQPANP